MSTGREKKTAVTNQKKKNKKISTKLLIYIIPVIIITITLLVLIAASVSKSRMSEMATETLESSISNQSDNIEAWLSENLQFSRPLNIPLRARLQPMKSSLRSWIPFTDIIQIPPRASISEQWMESCTRPQSPICQTQM